MPRPLQTLFVSRHSANDIHIFFLFVSQMFFFFPYLLRLFVFVHLSLRSNYLRFVHYFVGSFIFILLGVLFVFLCLKSIRTHSSYVWEDYKYIIHYVSTFMAGNCKFAFNLINIIKASYAVKYICIYINEKKNVSRIRESHPIWNAVNVPFSEVGIGQLKKYVQKKQFFFLCFIFCSYIRKAPIVTSVTNRNEKQ